ncbi:MAG: SMP-30/gluconolactonase/LRE family protein [Bacteroidia bacterium]|nr:SMP-30/gluconolactonase/LRE family protein [Bacteroidia bacterium]
MTKISPYKVNPLFDVIAEHGEGPIWDEQKHRFLWVDLLKGEFYEGNHLDGKFRKYSIGQALGVMGNRKARGKVMAVRDGFGLFDEEDDRFVLISPSPEQNNPEVRFNDGVMSPKGQFWAGTMEWDGKNKVGKLFRLNNDLSFSVLEEGLIIPNGMGWNSKEDTYFLTDTEQNCIFAYDYELEHDAISNRRIHIQFDEDVYPDGMAIDANDHFWIAIWNGAKILHLDPIGNFIEEIPLPVPFPTSCCFGGENMDLLFVSSSRYPLDEKGLNEYPLSGSCFLIETESKGKVDKRFDG